VAVAVVLVEVISVHELGRLRIDPLSVQSVKAVLVIRAAQIAAMLVPLALIRKIGPSALGLRWGDRREGLLWSLRVSAVLAAGFGLAVLVYALAGGGNLVRLAFGRSPLLEAETGGARVAILAGMVLVGPLAEELFFRGGLYTVLRRSFTAPQTILVTALFFAAAHAGSSPFPVIPFVGGLAFGFLFEKTGALFAPVLVHGAGNLAILLLPIMV
jgi:membrane protease YdiL (CAAX protease family)